MSQFLSWLKKYYTVILCFALVIAAVVMTVDFTKIFPVGEVVGEGKGTNHTVATREEFNAIWGDTVTPLLVWATQPEAAGVAAPSADQSLTLHITRDWNDDHGMNNVNYMLALSADAVYLKWIAYEDESGDGWSEKWGWQQEFYIKGSETYARMSDFYFYENGIEMKEADFKQHGVKDIEGVPIEMAFGDLSGKWVRVTGTRMAGAAKSEIEIALKFAQAIRLHGAFTAGEEPKLVLNNVIVTYDGMVYDIQGNPNYSSTTTAYALQYKYVQNTVIEDVSEKRIYELKDNG